ncbi:MAG: hypothetical protein V8R75_15605 [Oscillospiraceae bacterium]
MDYEKLIEQLKQKDGLWCSVHTGEKLVTDAADALTALLAENDRLRKERDAIEQDFRVFTKQWWEEGNGFPCRWCKFERSDVCEQKPKHPNDEKPCAGRWFEWRGPQKEV